MTHLATAVWAVFSSLILLKLTRGHGIGRAAVGFYGFSMVQLYLASGLFHGLLYVLHTGDLEARVGVVNSLWVFQRLDKSAVFLLIGGSFVPIFVYLLRGWWRVLSLAAVALVALLGVALIWVFPAFGHRWLVGIYVAMGLTGLIPGPIYMRGIGWKGAGWVVALLVAYVGGAAIEVMKWPDPMPGVFGYHELLHVCDMVGTLTHFVVILKYVIVHSPFDGDEPDDESCESDTDDLEPRRESAAPPGLRQF